MLIQASIFSIKDQISQIITNFNCRLPRTNQFDQKIFGGPFTATSKCLTFASYAKYSFIDYLLEYKLTKLLVIKYEL